MPRPISHYHQKTLSTDHLIMIRSPALHLFQSLWMATASMQALSVTQSPGPSECSNTNTELIIGELLQVNPTDARPVRQEPGSGRKTQLQSTGIQPQSLAPAKPSLSAVTTQGPQSSTFSTMLSSLSLPSNGPSAASYSIPPRPKPGRKPALDKPSEKRKAQNREAQRAFRERKVAHTEELRVELDQLRLCYNNVVSENEALKRKLQEIRDSRQQVEEQSTKRQKIVTDLQAEVHRYRQEEERWAKVERLHSDTQQRLKEHEDKLRTIDTTRKEPSKAGNSIFHRLENGMALASLQQHSPITPPEHSPVQDADPSCGNCAETGYCKCVEDFTIGLSTVPYPAPNAENCFDELEMDFTSQPTSKATTIGRPAHPATIDRYINRARLQLGNLHLLTSRTRPSSATRPADPMRLSSIVEPGTCLKCQADPEQRQFCIEVSKSRQPSSENPDRSAKRARLDDGRPQTMTCNELYQASKHVVAESRRSGKTKPQEMESIFNGYQRTHLEAKSEGEARPGMRYRTYSTLEMDGIETLAALRRTGG